MGVPRLSDISAALPFSQPALKLQWRDKLGLGHHSQIASTKFANASSLNQVEQAFLECKFNLLTREALVRQDEKESEPMNRLDRLYREAR